MAVDNDTKCYRCRYLYTGEMAAQGYCGDPDNYSWGYTECYVNWFQNCIVDGDGCYYVEVRAQ
ncbi:MAG TPA: hypothetical protein VHK90_08895 [Thermoanaerobaculia bacterium]|nr:hypothetical protein [Thermoanaerobaculia bacterium]